MNFIKQLLILLLSAGVIIGIGAGVYWLFHAGQSYLDASYSNSPLTSPILWLVMIIAAIVAVVSRIWRRYQEKLFIRQLSQRKAKSSADKQS
ncbi:hypothetical protein N7931_06810 [Catenovulum sp. 2E275]|uniref:hypothetical protein n=1 Tax=Catenovulum sp. 2E275 TaxID=2980497 RepID=UPI0021D1A090|nr:hypothetical protein [Catenovulum sp. 2E275]MCU4675341.1 hypothetical protein [Catenovulum sp. 2E275]